MLSLFRKLLLVTIQLLTWGSNNFSITFFIAEGEGADIRSRRQAGGECQDRGPTKQFSGQYHRQTSKHRPTTVHLYWPMLPWEKLQELRDVIEGAKREKPSNGQMHNFLGIGSTIQLCSNQ